jgi:hypothetical protein
MFDEHSTSAHPRKGREGKGRELYLAKREGLLVITI